MARSVSGAKVGGEGRSAGGKGRREVVAALLTGRRPTLGEAPPGQGAGPDPLAAAREHEEEDMVGLAVLDPSRDFQVRLGEALSRLAAGRYGLCADCGGPIPRDRLRALPFALRCLRCDERVEGEGSSRRFVQPAVTEGPHVVADPAVLPDAGETRCPFLEPARDDWVYPVTGYCRGLPQGALMIPTLFEYRTWCATDGHTACPIYQSKHWQGEVRMGGQA